MEQSQKEFDERFLNLKKTESDYIIREIKAMVTSADAALENNG